MALVDVVFPNLIGGVSQQPDALRLPSQCENSINFYPSIVDGLRTRPALRLIRDLGATDAQEARPFVHWIDRDAAERYVVKITKVGDLTVFDRYTGIPRTVAKPDGVAYLDYAGAAEDAFKAITLIDHTFIVNTEKTVELLPDLTPDRGFEAIVFINQVNYTVTYRIEIDGVEKAAFTTPGLAETPPNPAISTDTVASELATKLTTNLGTGWTIDQSGPIIHIRKDDASEFDIATTDSRGLEYTTTFTTTIQSFAKLPTACPDGYVVQITGDNTNAFDDYWVEFRSDVDGGIGQGTWKETVRPGIQYKFDPTTMPHLLVRESDGTFTFKQAEWRERKVGDDELNPAPSFVGNKIRNLNFFLGRLEFLALDISILSETAEQFNFWRTTVLTLPDSDPIETPTPTAEAGDLVSSIEFDETLLSFSTSAQFRLDYGAVLSPETAELKKVKSYEQCAKSDPVAAGKTVFLASTNGGSFGSILEFFVEDNGEVADLAPVSVQVPAYIQGKIREMSVSRAQQCLVLLSEDDPRGIYVYKYFWQGTEKLQSAWQRWLFPGDILSVNFIGANLAVVSESADGARLLLQQMDIEDGRKDEDAIFEFRLDVRMTDAQVSVAYDPGTDLTTYTFPRYFAPDQALVVVRPDGSGQAQDPRPYTLLPVVNETPEGYLQVEGDHTATPVYIGAPIPQVHTFSRQYLLTNAQGGGTKPRLAGVLNLLSFTLSHVDTAYYTVLVRKDPGEPPHNIDTHEFSGTEVGGENAVIGELATDTGEFAVDIAHPAKHTTVSIVVEGLFTPAQFVYAGFDGNYETRSTAL